MSTLKTDAIEAATGTNTDLSLDGKGTGVPDLGAGFKVGSVAGVPTASIRDDAVTTAKILNDNVTLAKLASGTDGELITWDASGDPATVAVGTATHVLTSNGAGAAPTFQAPAGGGWTAGTVQTISASNAHFTSLPAGLNYIIMIMNLSGSAPAGGGFDLVTIGDSGGLETTGYVSVSQYSTTMTNSTAGFEMNPQGNGLNHGTMHLTRITGNTWISTHMYMYSTTVINWGAGVKTLSGELTQIKGGNYGTGDVNIFYM